MIAVLGWLFYLVLFIANPVTGLGIPVFAYMRPLSVRTSFNIAAGMIMLVVLCLIGFRGDYTITPALAGLVLATPILQVITIHVIRASRRKGVKRANQPGLDA